MVDHSSSDSSRNQTLSFLKRRFEQVGIAVNPRHGQNFLIDLNLQRLIVEAGQLNHRDVVLEVGAGTGALTALMAQQAAAVVSVEIDERMHQLASEELIDFQNVLLLQQDALKNKGTISPAVLQAVEMYLAAGPARRFKLVANLPYNVATPLISNLLLTHITPAIMTVTIQKELADRIMAEPSTKDYGALSIWIQSQCQVELIRVLAPSVFWPRPKVTSAIIRITLAPERRAAIADLEFFHDFTRALFFHRRKFLRSVLASAMKHRLTKAHIDEVMADQQLGETSRAEELTVETIQKLCEAVRQKLLAVEQPSR